MSDLSRFSRRHLLRGAAAAACATAVPAVLNVAHGRDGRGTPEKITHGRIKQSIVFWCFNTAGEKWDVDTTCQVAKELGCVSVEIVEPEDWGTLKKHGLTCAIAPNGMPGVPFAKGLQQPALSRRGDRRTRKMIDACADAKCARRHRLHRLQVARRRRSQERRDQPRTRAPTNCVKGLKQAGRLRREERRHGLRGASQHARRLRTR